MKIKDLYLSGLLYLLVTGCSQTEIPLYSGTDGIYFNNRTAGQLLQDSAAYSFIYYDLDSMDVSVKVQTYGRTKPYDRPFLLEVNSENATEGIDYKLCTPAVIPAKMSSVDYIVRLYKNPILNDEILSLRLTLHPNGHFGTNYPLAPDTDEGSTGTNTLCYSISYSNQYTVPPKGWQTMFGGTFMPEKLDLLVKLFPEIPRQSYNESGAITLAKWSYMQKTAQEYVFQQVQYYMMGIPCDPLIFDRNGNTLDFTR